MNLNNYLSLGKKAYDYFKDGIIIIDNSFTIIYCNESACKLLGYSIEQLKNKKIKDICDSVYSLIISPEYANVLNSKKISPRLLPFIDSNKEEFYTLTFISNLGDKEISLGYMIVMQDTKSAKELNVSVVYTHMPYLRALNIKNDEFLYISDLKTGRNIFCSDSVEKFLGWEAFNFVNGSWAFAISKTHPDDVYNIENYYKLRERWYKHPYKFDHIPQHYKYRMLHKKGYYVHVKVTAMLLQRDEKEAPLYVITFGKTYQPKTESEFKPGSLLTRRETQVLQQLETGNSYKMAASELNISIDSVRTYIRRIYKKLNVHSITEAIHRAFPATIKARS